VGQRRLRHAQSFGCVTEVQLLIHGEEVAEMPEVNCRRSRDAAGSRAGRVGFKPQAMNEGNSQHVLIPTFVVPSATSVVRGVASIPIAS